MVMVETLRFFFKVNALVDLFCCKQIHITSGQLLYAYLVFFFVDVFI